MKTNYQDKSSGKLTESDIDRIARKVLQSEQVFPNTRDFFAGLKGIYSGRGYLPSKYRSAMLRVGKTFMTHWDEREPSIDYLYNLKQKIQNSSMDEDVKNKLSDAIEDFIKVREDYKAGITRFIDIVKE